VIGSRFFFSATISGKVKEIFDCFCANPVTISVEKQATAENVEQDVIKITNKNEKIDKLHDLLAQKEFEKCWYSEGQNGHAKTDK